MTWRKCLHKVCCRLCCRISVCYRSANSLGNYKSRMMKVRYLVYVFGEIVVQDIDSLTYIFSPKYCRTLIHLHLFSTQNISICYICNKIMQIAWEYYESRLMKVRYLVYVLGKLLCSTLIHIHIFSAQNIAGHWFTYIYFQPKMFQFATFVIKFCK